MLDKSTLQFLKNLKQNNNKEWFEVNRKKYDAARENFLMLVEEVLKGLIKNDERFSTLTAKSCLFRINRDVRFSKNKSPYKTNFGASITVGGKKSPLAGYYIHLEPGECFIGGGIYMPESENIQKIRQEIDYNWKEFYKIIQSKSFVSHYNEINKSKEFSLVREPKGYSKENPAIEYIKLKSWVAGKKITEKELYNPKLSKEILIAFNALKPLIDFLNKGLS
jgi:uncharacterized protein (TIGR02453 family)